MKGEEVKLKLKKAGVSITEIASILGMSRQSLSQALSVKDVKTGLIEDLSKALNVPLSYIYNDSSSQNAVANGNKSVAAINSNISSSAEDVLKERVKALESLVAEKERLINVLMENRK
jgi:transcriptional regulator with XRE-family HTH domain